jgi:pectate disaccharide-lyase
MTTAAAPSTSTPPGRTGSTLHVAPNGDDAATGNSDNPLRTITAAAVRARPGTTVLVREGRYEGDIATRTSGTADARIAFVAQSPQVKIVGGGAAVGAWENDGDYVDIVGFDISGDNEDGIYNRSSNVRIMNNRVYEFPTGNCIVTGNADYDLTDIDIIGNVVNGCGNDELDHGIYVGHQGGTVANNIAYGNPGFGIHCWQACDALLITNNLVYDNREGGIVVGAAHDDSVADDVLVSNNIVVANGREGIREGGATGDKNRYRNNLMWNNDRDRILLKTGTEVATIVADPELVDYRPDGSGDYRLRPSSPALDGGFADFAPSVAIDNTPRPQGRAVDVGVYEQ